jgi:hypothetical protein
MRIIDGACKDAPNKGVDVTKLAVYIVVGCVCAVLIGFCACHWRAHRRKRGTSIVGMCCSVRVRHIVAIYGQILLFCDQSMREKAWRSRKRGA